MEADCSHPYEPSTVPTMTDLDERYQYIRVDVATVKYEGERQKAVMVLHRQYLQTCELQEDTSSYAPVLQLFRREPVQATHARKKTDQVQPLAQSVSNTVFIVCHR